MDLLRLLLSNQQVLNTIGKRLGFKNGIPQQYIALASTLLFSALANKSKDSKGKNELFTGIKNRQSSQGLIGDLIGGVQDLFSKSDQDDEGIMDNLFGDKFQSIVQSFSKATGLNQKQSKQLLVVVGMLIVGFLAKRISEKDMSEDDLAKEIQHTYSNPEQGTETKDDGGLLEQIFNGQKKEDDLVGTLTNVFKQLILK